MASLKKIQPKWMRVSTLLGLGMGLGLLCLGFAEPVFAKDEPMFEALPKATLHGQVDKQEEAPEEYTPAPPPPQWERSRMMDPPRQNKALQAGVSLDVAIVEEDDVDWYRWYLNVRNYIATNGGLGCTVGTPIIIYRNGVFRPQSFDSRCAITAMSLNYPLPDKSRLQYVILPTRPFSLPPASREELYRMLKNGQ